MLQGFSGGYTMYHDTSFMIYIVSCSLGLRKNGSDSNRDLYINHLNASPACEDTESAEHYLFNYNRFDEQWFFLGQQGHFIH